MLKRLGLAAIALSCIPQLYLHTRDAWTGTYTGSAYEPRVKAILDVSRVAAKGGPYLCVPNEGKFEPADQLVNDLGVSFFGYVSAKLTGRPISRGSLLWLNLFIFVVSIVALALVTPVPYHFAIAACLIVSHVCVSEYRSPDPLATHGALALAAVAIASARKDNLWFGLGLGVGLMVVHKIRSPYAMYALAAALVVDAVTQGRRGRAWVGMAIGVVVIAIPWNLALRARAHDSQVTQLDTLGTHPIGIALLEGVGWSENKWGIKPFDPWVAEYLSKKYNLPAVNVGTEESERRAWKAYWSLWREDPLHLAGVYLKRAPLVRQHVILGYVGMVALVIIVPVAFVLTWGKRDVTGFLIALTVLTACLIFQTAVLDPRLLYAYPLRILSDLLLNVSILACWVGWLTPKPEIKLGQAWVSKVTREEE